MPERPKIKAGDRVRRLADSRVFMMKEGASFGYPSPEAYDPALWELVSVAHYAPPGVPIVALTHDLREAIAVLVRHSKWAYGEGSATKIVEDALATARGEAVQS